MKLPARIALPLSWHLNLNWVLTWLHWLFNQMNSQDMQDADRFASFLPGAAKTERKAIPHPDSPQAPYVLADLYRRYAGSLYWVCLRYVKNREDAEDMVNQVFLKVESHLDTFQGQSSIYSWMYRIAVNECIQLFRKRKFEVGGDFLSASEEVLPHHPEREWIAKLTMEKLFQKTDAQTMEIVFLLYYEGLSQDEVVEKLGISRRTLNRKVAAFKQIVDANL